MAGIWRQIQARPTVRGGGQLFQAEVVRLCEDECPGMVLCGVRGGEESEHLGGVAAGAKDHGGGDLTSFAHTQWVAHRIWRHLVLTKSVPLATERLRDSEWKKILKDFGECHENSLIESFKISPHLI